MSRGQASVSKYNFGQRQHPRSALVSSLVISQLMAHRSCCHFVFSNVSLNHSTANAFLTYRMQLLSKVDFFHYYVMLRGSDLLRNFWKFIASGGDYYRKCGSANCFLVDIILASGPIFYDSPLCFRYCVILC